MNLLKGVWDSLGILTFKWNSVRPKRTRWWLLVVLFIICGLLVLTAYSGTMVRDLVSLVGNNPQSQSTQQTILIWLNIFLAENASLAMSGIFWALVISILLIPLIGYSFASIVPEGDLASIQITEYHKIADSILLQFANSIAFVQILVLTAISSLLTIGTDAPGLGIVAGWSLWVIAVFLTVLSAWVFEYLYRRFGLVSKLISFGVIGVIALILILGFNSQTSTFFGLGGAYAQLVQGMTFEHPEGFFAVMGCSLIIIILLCIAISWTATRTLQIQERPKKKDKSRILMSRLGLVKFNKVNGLTQFFLRLLTRQSNIWRPLLLSTGFAVVMTIVFFNFYTILFTLSMLIPVMITLVWSINIFGILGSGSTWLVSLPGAKYQLLKSVRTVQYIIVVAITVLITLTAFIFYQPSIKSILDFAIGTVCATLVMTQFALEKSVYSPHRYRVHIRGESVLPPNKAFGYMIVLFFWGAVVSGLVYGVGSLPFSVWMSWLPPELNVGVQLLAQIVVAFIVYLVTRRRFNRLQHNWLYQSEVLQQIVKTVGTQN